MKHKPRFISATTMTCITLIMLASLVGAIGILIWFILLLVFHLPIVLPVIIVSVGVFAVVWLYFYFIVLPEEDTGQKDNEEIS